MQLLLIIAVVAVLGVADSAPDQPLPAGLLYTTLAMVCMAAAPLFAVAISRLTVTGLDDDLDERRRRLHRFGRMRTVHTFIWSLSTVAVVYFFGWTQLVRCNWRLQGAFLADELLILLPVVLPMLLSWAAFYEVDFALATSMPSGKLPISSRTSYVALHARQYLGLLLAPVLILLALQDAIEWLAPRFAESGNEVVVYLAALLMLVIFLPVLIRRVWRTAPLPPGVLRERLVAINNRGRAPIRDILVWQTDDRVVNAAVAGFFGRWRYLFLSDALLRHLAKDEVAAVFAHEVGHIRHRHAWFRMLAILAPFAVLASFDALVPQAHDWLAVPLETFGLPTGAAESVVVAACIFVYVVAVFGPYCRLLEYQADLFACTRGVPDCDTQSFCVALERISAVSGISLRRASWLHPSSADRIARAVRLTGDASLARRFSRRLRWINATMCGVTLISGLVFLAAL